MTPDEACFFYNHKYGEQAYLITDNMNILHIYTIKGKWMINLNDLRRFGVYTLSHGNEVEGAHYHKQMRGHDLTYLVFYAMCHDSPTGCYGSIDNYNEFRRLWLMYQLGRQCEERAYRWDWLCGKELI